MRYQLLAAATGASNLRFGSLWRQRHFSRADSSHWLGLFPIALCVGQAALGTIVRIGL